VSAALRRVRRETAILDRRLAPGALLALALACGGGAAGPPAPISTVPRGAIEPVVARDAVLFAPDGVPDAIDALLGGARLVVFGEAHYVEEHQRFLVRLLPKLHAAGLRVLLQEEMTASAWAGDEYARLRSDALPIEVGALNRILLDGLRAFNAGLAEADRIAFEGVDANHWPDILQTALADFQVRFGAVAALAGLMAAPPDSAAYQAALAALPATLAGQAADLEAQLGPARHALLLDLVDVELRSLPWRLRQDGAAREAIIERRVAAALAAAGSGPVALNMGAWHSQRVRQMPPSLQPVAAWLAVTPSVYGGDPAALRVIACVPARGMSIANFTDPWAFAFDVRHQAENDLTRILSERAGDQAALLPLADPVFDGAALSFALTRNVFLLQPGRLWDALVLYPSATVLTSLAPYR
jgi:hypothetical protein